MYPSSETVDELQERFCQLDAINGSTYSQEDTVQGKPHIFTLSVGDSVSADQREALAVKAGKYSPRSCRPSRRCRSNTRSKPKQTKMGRSSI